MRRWWVAMDGFPKRLDLVLKALSFSRGQLAVELAVNKSMVSRWLTGDSRPSGHNLAKLTKLIAARRPGFSMLDWDACPEQLAGRLAAPAPAADTAPALAGWLPDQVLREALLATTLRGEAMEGHWRTTRPSITSPGQFSHDRVIITRSENGLLRFRMGVDELRFDGWGFPLQNQIFAHCADPVTGIFIYAILNAVLRRRADVLDGVSLTCQPGGGGTPVASPILLERTGLLTGDPVADDARFEASLGDWSPAAPEGSIPEAIAAHLWRDIGPAAHAAGGDALMAMAFVTSMSRGPVPDARFPP